jgi:hypothetical protein
MGQRMWWPMLWLVMLSGCMPLFLPPIPSNPLVAETVWRVSSESALAWNGAGLELRVRFSEIPEAAWVAVQWFGASNGERASASYWVEPSDLEADFTWPLPADIVGATGAWRAVVSVGSTLLRQFDGSIP